MKKPMSSRKQAISTLKTCIRESRKLARQINRKLESLAQWNKATQAAKNEMIRIMGTK